MSLAGRRDGSAHRTDDAGLKRTVYTSRARGGLMADAALARGAAAGFCLPAILELSFGPGGIRWTAVHKSTTAPWERIGGPHPAPPVTAGAVSVRPRRGSPWTARAGSLGRLRGPFSTRNTS